MNRRTFLCGFTLGTLAAPLAGEAQPPPTKTARIGYLSPRSGPSIQDEAFRQGMRELGYVEGQNISVEYRFGDWRSDRISVFAAELVRLKVDVIVASGGATWALTAKRATTTIPIVFIAGDSVGTGLVASLDRPGGNLTGVALLTDALNVKRLQFLTEAAPGVSRIAVLANPANATMGRVLKDLEAVAQTLRVTLQVLEARGPREIDDAFAAMTKKRAGALLVLNDPMLFAQRGRIVDLAMKSRVPAAYEWREFVEAGGFLSYFPVQK